jgi:hypothetical protein
MNDTASLGVTRPRFAAECWHGAGPNDPRDQALKGTSARLARDQTESAGNRARVAQPTLLRIACKSGTLGHLATPAPVLVVQAVGGSSPLAHPEKGPGIARSFPFGAPDRDRSSGAGTRPVSRRVVADPSRARRSCHAPALGNVTRASYRAKSSLRLRCHQRRCVPDQPARNRAWRGSA